MTCCIIFRARWFKREQDVLNNDLILFILILRCAIECILFLSSCSLYVHVQNQTPRTISPPPPHASIMSPITAVSVEVNLARVQTDFTVFHIGRVSNPIWTKTCRLFASPLSFVYYSVDGYLYPPRQILARSNPCLAIVFQAYFFGEHYIWGAPIKETILLVHPSLYPQYQSISRLFVMLEYKSCFL